MRDGDLAVASAVEAALLARDDGKVWRGGSAIRFRCPVHDDQRPSATYDRDGGVWTCYSCGAGGGLTWGEHRLAELLGITPGASSVADIAEIAARLAKTKVERELADERAAKSLSEYWRERRLAQALARHSEIIERLEAEGVTRIAAERFSFGYADYKGEPALAIPWTARGEIRGLQYRLLGDISGGRYRWHEGSKTETLFNADAVLEPEDDTILVVEGAKKAAALWGHGITSVCAVTNKNGWRERFAAPFKKFKRVVFVPDPDAREQAFEWAETVENGHVARMPDKPDDFLVRTGGDVDALWWFVERAVPVDAKGRAG